MEICKKGLTVHGSVMVNIIITLPSGFMRTLRAATNESQKKTRNKKQETKRFSTFAVSRLRHKNCLIRESIAKHV